MTSLSRIARNTPRWLRDGVLGLAALAALRQSFRIRLSFAGMAPPAPASLAEPPHVSIVLPVRDEAANIDGIIGTLLAQDYPNFDLIVVDDGSTDDTPRLLATWVDRDPRLRVHRIEQLPEGWAGKTHASHAGTTLTAGEWLLFTDADTRHAPETLRLMVGHAVSHDDDLLSMFTGVRLIGSGTRLLTPIGALSLVERATVQETRDPAHPTAIAIGQYLLVRRTAYVETGGYAAPVMRTTYADDVALAEMFKRHGRRVDIVDGRHLVANEQWTTWATAWRGWRKSIYGTVAPRPVIGLVGGLWLIAYGLLPLLTLLRTRRPLALLLAAVTLAAQLDARAFFDRHAGLSRWWSLTAPAGWAVLGACVLDATRLALIRQGADWKGRRAPSIRRGA